MFGADDSTKILEAPSRAVEKEHAFAADRSLNPMAGNCQTIWQILQALTARNHICFEPYPEPAEACCDSDRGTEQ